MAARATLWTAPAVPSSLPAVRADGATRRPEATRLRSPSGAVRYFSGPGSLCTATDASGSGGSTPRRPFSGAGTRRMPRRAPRSRPGYAGSRATARGRKGCLSVPNRHRTTRAPGKRPGALPSGRWRVAPTGPWLLLAGWLSLDLQELDIEGQLSHWRAGLLGDFAVGKTAWNPEAGLLTFDHELQALSPAENDLVQ
jgi:hypothetical protein